jgi:hypothetical protein
MRPVNTLPRATHMASGNPSLTQAENGEQASRCQPSAAMGSERSHLHREAAGGDTLLDASTHVL